MTQTSCSFCTERLQLETQSHQSDYLCGTEPPIDFYRLIFPRVTARTVSIFFPVLLAHAVIWLVTLLTGDSRLRRVSKNVGCQSQDRALMLQVFSLSLSSLKGEGSRAPRLVLSLPAAGVPCWDLSQRCRGLPRQASPGVRPLPAEDLLQTGRKGDLSLLQASPTTPAPQK